MNIPAKTVVLAAVLLVATTALFSERSWAKEKCPGTTIAPASADCLKATREHTNTTLTVENECVYEGGRVLGKVAVEVMISNWETVQPDGTTAASDHVYIKTLTTNQPDTTSLDGSKGPSSFVAARCCPDLGICQKTDCDTTNGVIDDTEHKSHCYLIDDDTGRVVDGVEEIEDGVVTETADSG